MLVSHNYRFIYLKTHKTAGTSVEELLEPLCRDDDKTSEHSSDEYISPTGIVGRRYMGKKTIGIWENHTLPQTIKENLGLDLYNDYYKICNIRNPYDVMVSLYHWRLRDTSNINESDFLNFCQLNKNDWVINNNKIFWGEPCDFYIRYEQLNDDIIKLSDELKLNIGVTNLEHYKKSDRGEYQLYYNEESKKIVSEIFENELKKFNYIF